jgi:thiosulfate/3-mercaptopyruvate sulfurtransferase
VTNLVSTEKLAGHLDHVVVIDCSWHLPTAKRNARAEFEAAHIPGARFYDLDAGSDPNTTLPHMLPSPEKFEADVMALGVSANSVVVCYDTVGLFSAARLWWMFKTFGHDKVTVLDGGLPKWTREGRAVAGGLAKVASGSGFAASLNSKKLRNITQVADAITNQSAQIVDARSATRFRGEEPEPRPGVKPGHLPGAHNVHYASLLNADGTMKSVEALRILFEAAGIDVSKPVITSCGSGVTAAIVTLALTQIHTADHALYDGSWAEWGASGREIVVGH